MAITGRFVADFSSFQNAVQQSVVTLRLFETGAGKVETSLNKMADAYSGRKLISDVSLSVEAVERLGGVSKLTKSEFDALSAKAAEAAEKMKAMGQEVPPGIAKIAAEAKTTTSSFDGMRNIVSQLMGAFGVAFSIGAVVNFGKEIFSLADNLVKLSDKTGLTIEEVQRLSGVAVESGNTVEELTGAISKMQKNLADPKAQQALRDLRINFAQFTASSPYQQLQLIADAFGNIANPARQAQLATALFGKTGTEILPTLKSNFSELAGAIKVASAEEVKAIDATGDAMARLGATVKAESINIIGSLVLAGEQAKNVGLLKTLAAFVANGAPATIAALAEIGGAAGKTGKDINLALPTDPLTEYRKHLDETKASMVSLSDAQKDIINEAIALGESQTEIASALNLSTQAVAAFVDGQKEAVEQRLFVLKLKEQWDALYREMRITGITTLAEYTKKVQEAMAKQREAVQEAQLQLLGLITVQRTEISNLNGTALTGIDAAMAALDKKYESDMRHVEDLGRRATEAGVGGAAWSQQAQEAADNAYRIYVEQFNRIVADSNKTFGADVPAAMNSSELSSAAAQGASGINGPFTLAFQSVSQAADAMAAHVASVLGAMVQTDAYRKAGFFINPGFGTADTINRTALSNIGLTLPGYASGGPVTRDGPIYAHKGEYVLPPNSRSGGTTITFEAGAIVVQGGGADAGRQIGDAIVSRLKSSGRRL